MRDVVLGPEARAQLGAAPPQPKKRIRAALRGLKAGEDGLDLKLLTLPADRRPTYRLRVGDWRVVYEVVDYVARVLRAFHRRDGYGWLERT